jgi:hypothetical protein
MSQPPPYNITTDFSQDEANNSGGRSTVRTANLDAEFANIELTLDAILGNLVLIQRDDGKLQDEVVEFFNLSPDCIAQLGADAAVATAQRLATDAAAAAAVTAAALAVAAASTAASGTGNWTERESSVDGSSWVVNGGNPIISVRHIFVNGRRQRLSDFTITLATGSVICNYVLQGINEIDINWT